MSIVITPNQRGGYTKPRSHSREIVGDPKNRPSRERPVYGPTLLLAAGLRFRSPIPRWPSEKTLIHQMSQL